MRRRVSLLAPLWIVSALACAQTPSSGGQAPSPQLQRHSPGDVPSSGVTLTAATELVVVDVVVEDRDGHPVHGLKAADFQLVEGKTPQNIKSFEEHTSADAKSAAALPRLPAMPAGVFTDFTPVPDTASLNVLLLDSLNTPMTDQSYVRSQLQQYVKHAQPGTRIAIFGLNQRLVFLQGFSSDPEVLKNVVEHKLLPRASNLLDDPVSGGPTDLLSDQLSEAGASASAVANLQQFEADNATFQTTLREQYTLAAFNDLARYLAGFPGRKNLIWFSGSFPLTIFGDPTLQDPFQAQAQFGDELRQTTSLLDRARVAVYPIDARGLQIAPAFSAANSGRQYVRNPGRLQSDLSNFSQNNAEEHFSMQQIADETGGHAFYNTNGLAEAVGKALDAGANFYTLTYSPVDHEWNGKYRTIHVKLQGELSARNLKLAYRNGYYADDPAKPRNAATTPLVAANAAGNPITSLQARTNTVMQRGAPTPSEILFKVRVLPDSTATTAAIDTHNEPNPKLKLKGPFRLYDVDFAAVATDLNLQPAPDGLRHGQIEFVAFLYDADGVLLNADGSTLNIQVKPETYALLRRQGMQFRIQISAPARGDTFLRVAVHDKTNGKYGVVEVPTSVVSRLAPPPPPPPTAASAPAATGKPATPPAPASAPAPPNTPAPATTPPAGEPR